MNIGKSIRVALAQKEKNNEWLANMMGCSASHIRALAVRKSATGTTIERLARCFDMTVSEFVALGE